MYALTFTMSLLVEKLGNKQYMLILLQPDIATINSIMVISNICPMASL